MCLAVPLKILRINGQKAVVGDEGHEHEVDIALLDNPQVGEYILAHGDLAINKVPEDDALKIISLVNGKGETKACPE